MFERSNLLNLASYLRIEEHTRDKPHMFAKQSS